MSYPEYFDWIRKTLLWIHNKAVDILEIDFEQGTVWFKSSLQLPEADGRPATITATAQQINALSGLVDGDGDILLSDTVWDDLRFPAAGIDPVGAAADPSRDTTDGRFIFSGLLDNTIAIQAQMPHAWKAGTAIHPHLHWSPTTTDTGTVEWTLQHKIANIDGVFPGSWTTLSLSVTPAGVVDTHQLDEFTSIDMTGYIASCMLLVILTRKGSTDDCDETVKLNELDFHYEIDKLGSKVEDPSG